MKTKLSPANRGFTLIEILIVIGIIGVLLAILLPALEKAREQAETLRCAANLNQIGVAMLIYANENQGNYPRTMYQPGTASVPYTLNAGTGINAPDPFGPGGPSANDMSAALFLLIRVQRIPTQIFVDPYTDEIAGVPDPVTDPTTQSNFTNYKQNLGYSYANPYPNAAAATAGYKLTNKMSAKFAIAGDMNPGTGAGNNSRNHEGRGQNVLYADNHVEFMTKTNVGQNTDEIYVNTAGVVKASPVDPTDSVLLPPGN